MRVLILSHNFDPFIGGIEVTIKVLANAFVQAGYDVRLMTWTKEPSTEVLQFKIIRNPSIWRLISEHSWADFVFENNPCLRLAWPGIFIKRPSFVVIHTWITRPDGRIGLKDRIKIKWWLDRAEKVIAVSKALRDNSYKDAVILGNFYREKEFRIIEGLPRDKTYVFLGRLVTDKGVELAIRAIHELRKDISNNSSSREPSLTVIGDGPDRRKLVALVEKLDLEQRVIFLGALKGEELVRCLNRHRFILIPSIWEEPFGLVALEGMACGCIPIVSEGGGLPEAIGDAGYIFKKGSLQSLVACLKEVAKHPEDEPVFRAVAQMHLKNYRSSFITRRYLDEIELTLSKYKK